VKIKRAEETGIKEVASKSQTLDNEDASSHGGLGRREIRLKKKLTATVSKQGWFTKEMQKNKDDLNTSEQEAAAAQVQVRMTRLKNSRQGTPYTRSAFDKAVASSVSARDAVIKLKQIVDEDILKDLDMRIKFFRINTESKRVKTKLDAKLRLEEFKDKTDEQVSAQKDVLDTLETKMAGEEDEIATKHMLEKERIVQVKIKDLKEDAQMKILDIEIEGYEENAKNCKTAIMHEGALQQQLAEVTKRQEDKMDALKETIKMAVDNDEDAEDNKKILQNLLELENGWQDAAAEVDEWSNEIKDTCKKIQNELEAAQTRRASHGADAEKAVCRKELRVAKSKQDKASSEAEKIQAENALEKAQRCEEKLEKTRIQKIIFKAQEKMSVERNQESDASKTELESAEELANASQAVARAKNEVENETQKAENSPTNRAERKVKSCETNVKSIGKAAESAISRCKDLKSKAVGLRTEAGDDHILMEHADEADVAAEDACDLIASIKDRMKDALEDCAVAKAEAHTSPTPEAIENVEKARQKEKKAESEDAKAQVEQELAFKSKRAAKNTESESFIQAKQAVKEGEAKQAATKNALEDKILSAKAKGKKESTELYVNEATAARAKAQAAVTAAKMSGNEDMVSNAEADLEEKSDRVRVSQQKFREAKDKVSKTKADANDAARAAAEMKSDEMKQKGQESQAAAKDADKEAQNAVKTAEAQKSQIEDEVQEAQKEQTAVADLAVAQSKAAEKADVDVERAKQELKSINKVVGAGVEGTAEEKVKAEQKLKETKKVAEEKILQVQKSLQTQEMDQKKATEEIRKLKEADASIIHKKNVANEAKAKDIEAKLHEAQAESKSAKSVCKEKEEKSMNDLSDANEDSKEVSVKVKDARDKKEDNVAQLETITQQKESMKDVMPQAGEAEKEAEAVVAEDTRLIKKLQEKQVSANEKKRKISLTVEKHAKGQAKLKVEESVAVEMIQAERKDFETRKLADEDKALTQKKYQKEEASIAANDAHVALVAEKSEIKIMRSKLSSSKIGEYDAQELQKSMSEKITKMEVLQVNYDKQKMVVEAKTELVTASVGSVERCHKSEKMMEAKQKSAEEKTAKAKADQNKEKDVKVLGEKRDESTQAEKDVKDQVERKTKSVEKAEEMQKSESNEQVPEHHEKSTQRLTERKEKRENAVKNLNSAEKVQKEAVQEQKDALSKRKAALEEARVAAEREAAEKVSEKMAADELAEKKFLKQHRSNRKALNVSIEREKKKDQSLKQCIKDESSMEVEVAEARLRLNKLKTITDEAKVTERAVKADVHAKKTMKKSDGPMGAAKVSLKWENEKIKAQRELNRERTKMTNTDDKYTKYVHDIITREERHLIQDSAASGAAAEVAVAAAEASTAKAAAGSGTEAASKESKVSAAAAKVHKRKVDDRLYQQHVLDALEEKLKPIEANCHKKPTPECIKATSLAKKELNKEELILDRYIAAEEAAADTALAAARAFPTKPVWESVKAARAVRDVRKGEAGKAEQQFATNKDIYTSLLKECDKSSANKAMCLEKEEKTKRAVAKSEKYFMRAKSASEAAIEAAEAEYFVVKNREDKMFSHTIQNNRNDVAARIVQRSVADEKNQQNHVDSLASEFSLQQTVCVETVKELSFLRGLIARKKEAVVAEETRAQQQELVVKAEQADKFIRELKASEKTCKTSAESTLKNAKRSAATAVAAYEEILGEEKDAIERDMQCQVKVQQGKSAKQTATEKTKLANEMLQKDREGSGEETKQQLSQIDASIAVQNKKASDEKQSINENIKTIQNELADAFSDTEKERIQQQLRFEKQKLEDATHNDQIMKLKAEKEAIKDVQQRLSSGQSASEKAEKLKVSIMRAEDQLLDESVTPAETKQLNTKIGIDKAKLKATVTISEAVALAVQKSTSDEKDAKAHVVTTAELLVSIMKACEAGKEKREKSERRLSGPAAETSNNEALLNKAEAKFQKCKEDGAKLPVTIAKESADKKEKLRLVTIGQAKADKEQAHVLKQKVKSTEAEVSVTAANEATMESKEQTVEDQEITLEKNATHAPQEGILQVQKLTDDITRLKNVVSNDEQKIQHQEAEQLKRDDDILQAKASLKEETLERKGSEHILTKLQAVYANQIEKCELLTDEYAGIDYSVKLAVEENKCEVIRKDVQDFKARLTRTVGVMIDMKANGASKAHLDKAESEIAKRRASVSKHSARLKVCEDKRQMLVAKQTNATEISMKSITKAARVTNTSYQHASANETECNHELTQLQFQVEKKDADKKKAIAKYDTSVLEERKVKRTIQKEPVTAATNSSAYKEMNVKTLRAQREGVRLLHRLVTKTAKAVLLIRLKRDNRKKICDMNTAVTETALENEKDAKKAALSAKQDEVKEKTKNKDPERIAKQLLTLQKKREEVKVKGDACKYKDKELSKKVLNEKELVQKLKLSDSEKLKSASELTNKTSTNEKISKRKEADLNKAKQGSLKAEQAVWLKLQVAEKKERDEKAMVKEKDDKYYENSSKEVAAKEQANILKEQKEKVIAKEKEEKALLEVQQEKQFKAEKAAAEARAKEKESKVQLEKTNKESAKKLEIAEKIRLKMFYKVTFQREISLKVTTLAKQRSIDALTKTGGSGNLLPDTCPVQISPSSELREDAAIIQRHAIFMKSAELGSSKYDTAHTTSVEDINDLFETASEYHDVAPKSELGETPMASGGVFETNGDAMDMTLFAQDGSGNAGADCRTFAWAVFGKCSKKCGGGVKTRYRHVSVDDNSNFLKCAATAQRMRCNSHKCPVKCVVKFWEGWGECSKTCGTGAKRRYRKVETPPQHGGTNCPELNEAAPCNTEPCPIECKLSNWGRWSKCLRWKSARHGAGTTYATRKRRILRKPAQGAKPCAEIIEEKLCPSIAASEEKMRLTASVELGEATDADCELSSWSPFSFCSAVCGEGKSTRLRSVLRPATGNGKRCDSVMKEEKTCGNVPCPVHCRASNWEAWSKCDSQCGGGQQQRMRKIEAYAKHGGRSCGMLEETRACSTQPCAIDCKMTPWTHWDPCSRTCGGGKESRGRLVIQRAENGGAECGDMQEERMCNTQLCPIDCVMSAWDSFSKCSTPCGGGKREAKRTVKTLPLYDGKKCPDKIKSESCNIQDCPVNCEMAEWEPWSQCSKNCGDGMTTRKRRNKVLPMFGGMGCPAAEETKRCNTHACNMEESCVMGPWRAFSSCSKHCGTGVKKRSRTVISIPAGYKEEACGDSSEERKCQTQPCSVACKMSDWTPWSSCSEKCDGGEQTRGRKIQIESKFGGPGCPEKIQSRQCNTHVCASDCKVTEWGFWSNCDKKCGSGRMKRERTIVSDPSGNGKDCGNLKEERTCASAPCPVDCVMFPWSPFSICSATCGHGVQVHTREVMTTPLYGGKACDVLSEEQSCKLKPCPVDCKVTPWNQWSQCSESCDGGSQIRSRVVVIPAQSNGLGCPTLNQGRKCNTHACDRECKHTAWASWSQCSAKCGGGMKERKRGILEEATANGAGCGALSEAVSCNTRPCPTNCKVSPWKSWLACSHTCDGGKEHRSRSVIKPKDGGQECPNSLHESRACDEAPCKVACVLSEWGAWSKCSKACGGGVQVSLRNIFKEATNAPSCSKNLSRERSCNTQVCPVDCAVSKWGEWQKCSKNCGGGETSRSRSITVKPKFDGKECPNEIQTLGCNSQACESVCKMSFWTPWSSCTKSCGTGIIERTRSRTDGDGKYDESCGEEKQKLHCNTHDCPVECQMTEWTAWSFCTSPCGGGVQARAREITRRASQGGKPCGPIADERTCSNFACPQDCLVGPWSAWDDCTQKCGTGDQRRSRTITRKESFGGRGCPASQDIRMCNTRPCAAEGNITVAESNVTALQLQNSTNATIDTVSPVSSVRNTDCKVSPWGEFQPCSEECGGGERQRFREVLKIAQGNGKGCPALQDTRSCNTRPCPIQCKSSIWSEWTKCSAPCDGGLTKRARSVTQPAKFGGIPCGNLVAKSNCNIFPCAAKCQFTDWSKWSSCSTTCGGGQKERTRTLFEDPDNLGKKCGAINEMASCNAQPCPVHCKLGEWSDWGQCSKLCDGGIQSATRKIVVPPMFGGSSCGAPERSRGCNLHACPVDCATSSWNSWKQCSKKCGGGKQSRSRFVLNVANSLGKPCGSLEQTRQCGTNPCDKHQRCRVKQWSEWSSCSTKCGGGMKTRARSLVVKECPHPPLLVESRSCHTHACPIECTTSSWSKWSQCSSLCGKGFQMRDRLMLTPPEFGGKHCVLEEEKSCMKDCPIDCEVSQWTGWTRCSKACEKGERTRSRFVLREPYGKGKACPQLLQKSTCNSQKCETHCEMTKWAPWTPCSQDCDTGESSRTRQVIVSPSANGRQCSATKQELACNTQDCDSECVFGSWTDWSSCSRSCGKLGTMSRTRLVESGPAAGKSCGEATQTLPCHQQACPEHCSVSDWSAWATCSKDCGGGESKRTRGVLLQPTFGGDTCPELEESRACNTDECSVNCKVSAWTKWSPCSSECGVGTQFKTRIIDIFKSKNGAACPDLKVTRQCNTQPCPVDCKYTEWDVGECSEPCGGGQSWHKRTLISTPENEGQECVDISRLMPCNNQPCSSQALSQPEWVDTHISGDEELGDAAPNSYTQNANMLLKKIDTGDFDKILIDCEKMKESNNATLKNYKCFDSCKPAGFISGTLHRNPHRQYRPTKKLDCTVQSWHAWSKCSVTCGGGLQHRNRVVQVHDRNLKASQDQNRIYTIATHGWKMDSLNHLMSEDSCYAHMKTCGAASEYKKCNQNPCDENACQVSAWSEWSVCDKQCDGGLAYRDRLVIQPARPGGKACPVLRQSKDCNSFDCPAKCSISPWGYWSKCSKSCSGGTMKQTRSILADPKNLGDGKYESKGCGRTIKTKICNAFPCPKPCGMSTWSSWSSCSAKCDGNQTRYREVSALPENGGTECGPKQQVSLCHMKDAKCDQDCEVTSWSTWSGCSAKCGGGQQLRTRKIETPQVRNGKACPLLTESQRCNSAACPVPCTLTPWSLWGTCSKACEGGMQSSTRLVLRRPLDGGKKCGPVFRQQQCGAEFCPGNCGLSAWGTWSRCSKMCGTGQQRRNRAIVKPPEKDGVGCGVLAQTRDCNTVTCGQECKAGPWSPWAVCSETCGGGQTRRTRTVDVFDAVTGTSIELSDEQKREYLITDTNNHIFHGPGGAVPVKTCKAASEVRTCNTKPCPQDCKVGKWSLYGDCSKPCGGGVQRRSRMIQQAAKRGGKECPDLAEDRVCNNLPCGEVNCLVSKWQTWSKCSRTCAGGEQVRSRLITTATDKNGRGCPGLSEKRMCNTAVCPVHCKVAQWSLWTPCTKQCNTGRQYRQRKIVQQPLYGGDLCPHVNDQRVCNTIKCPVNCQVYAWTRWSACSKECDSGTQTKTRSVAVQDAFGGRACPELKVTKSCNTQACPIHCEVGSWSRWNQCSKECLGGIQTRYRPVNIKPQFNGTACPELSKTQKCNKHACQVNCKVGRWSPFSRCSKTCGGGLQKRTRPIETMHANGGENCPTLEHERSCNSQPCPINCVVSAWTPFSQCSAKCNGGTRLRTRTTKVRAKYGGTLCPVLSDFQECNNKACPVDCVMGPFTPLSDCSAKCGTGKQKYGGDIIVIPRYGGTPCPPREKEVACNKKPCKIHCKLGEWFPWSDCTKKCDGGISFRKRPIAVKPAYGGKECDSVEQERKCNTKPCVHSDCKTSPWGEWSKCSKACGTGTTTRSRKVTVAAQGNGGEGTCGILKEEQECSIQSCPIDCKVSEWGSGQKCTQKCGGGTSMSSRTILQRPAFGGEDCPALMKTEKCNEQACPVDCVVSNFGPPSKCDKACGPGKSTKKRKVLVQPTGGGKTCPALEQQEECKDRDCPEDCVVSDWSPSSVCSKSCGGGTIANYREVLSRAQNGGKGCPALEEHIPCNTQKCPVDCVAGPYSKWSTCDKPCGGGLQFRTREVVTANSGGGQRCKNMYDERGCNTHLCPQNCEVSPWMGFSRCSKSCGGGTQSRDRTIITPTARGGLPCPEISEVRDCNAVPCEKECETRVGGFSENFGFGTCSDNMNNLLSVERSKCEKEKKDFILKSATDGSGGCIAHPGIHDADLSRGELSDKIKLHDDSTETQLDEDGSSSVTISRMEADVGLSCPLSLNSTLTPEDARNAKPYAVCVVTQQKICSDLRTAPSCIATSQTRCEEVCVHPKYCESAGASGALVSRKHGWRTPDGQACCFKDCKVPTDWYLEDGSPMEPAAWCYQMHQAKLKKEGPM